MDAGTPRTEAVDDDSPLDPRDALALLDAEHTRTQRHLQPDARLLYGVWGAAWLVGFLAVWAALTGRGPLVLPPAVAGTVFAALLLTAVVVTGVHVARRTSGVSGASSAQGAMHGWAWLMGFACLAAITGAVGRTGAGPEVMGLLGPALSGLVVGLLYLASGAMWHERAQYSLGVWILVASGAGAVAGYPTNNLVMGLLGGGGFLVAAAVVTVRGRSA